MKKKGSNFTKLIDGQNIIILLIVCTVGFYLIHPSSIYQGNNKFNTECVNLEEAQLYIQDLTIDSIFYLLGQGGNNVELKVYQYPMELKRIIQYLDTHIIFKDRYLSDVYQTDDKIYITVIKGTSQLWLLTIDGIEGSFENQQVYDLDSLYYFLHDSTITKNNFKFYKHVIFADEDLDQTYIQEYNGGYRICFTKSFFIELRKFHQYDELEKNQEYNFITKLLNKTIRSDTLFDEYDVYDLVYYFSAIQFHNNQFFEAMDKDFLPIICPILGMNDVNNDGNDDILIQINGDRFFPKILIAYDLINSCVIWTKKSYPDIKDMKFLDVDNDGIEEMLCTTYAPCVEMFIGFHDYNAWLLFESYFFILDNEGNIKKIGGKDAIVQSYQGFTEFQSVIIEDDSKVLLGLKSNYKNNEKNFITYDYKTGQVDTLEQKYTNILYMRKTGDRMVYYDQHENLVNEYEFNKNLSEAKVLYSKSFGSNIEKFIYHVVELFNKNYNIIMGKNRICLLVDDKLNIKCIFQNGIYETGSMVHSKHNTFYFIDKQKNYKYFSKVTFTKNTSINPFMIILLLCELLILFIFLVFKQVLRVPIPSAKDNYFVIHSFFGLLYTWRLNGVYSRFFRLPRRMSFNKKTAHKLLYDISDKVQEFYTHSALFVKTKVYKIHTENELSIIQRISHDLKNQIMMIKLQMDEYTDRIKRKQAQEMGSMLETIKEISVASQTLSNFSQINQLYKEKVEINSLIDQILAELQSHEKTDCLQFQSDHDYFITIDKKLIKIALKNLIANALDAIKNDQQIMILVKQVDHLISIIIKNPTEITQEEFEQVEGLGFTTKKTGSGLGIPISRSIIEKHNGKFQIVLKDDYFIVEIYLPYES